MIVKILNIGKTNCNFLVVFDRKGVLLVYMILCFHLNTGYFEPSLAYIRINGFMINLFM